MYNPTLKSSGFQKNLTREKYWCVDRCNCYLEHYYNLKLPKIIPLILTICFLFFPCN